MSEHKNNSIGSLQGIEGFKPLNAEEELHITGGGAAALKAAHCADDEYQDPVTGKCLKKSYSPTGGAS